ncbi:Rap guanine nucleotide exchange factor 6 [Taenia solium]|eukprot:TsM_000879300 transcript=TsM_000879300 gene=TsM_000879300
MGSENSEVLRILKIPPDKRSNEELVRLHDFLGGVEGLQRLRPRSQREVALQEAARLARLMRVRGESLLFRRGDPASAWFILLSGCVLIDHSMFLPRNW